MSDLTAQTQFQFLTNTIRTDGLVNATALAKAYRNTSGVRKDVRDWLLTPSAQVSIAYLERVTGTTVPNLVNADGVGTWIHPKLAPILAMWISPEFYFAVVDLIEHYLNIAQPQLPDNRALALMVIAEADRADALAAQIEADG